jgi:hypothetical protein
MSKSLSPFPHATISEETISIQFSDTLVSQSAQVACTVDLTDFSDVVGIEALDWRKQLSGGTLDAPSSQGRVRWSYDDEMDAIYIRVSDGRGQIQRSAVGEAGLDSDRRVVRLDVPRPVV